MKRKIILASTSPRRREILSKTDLEFEVVPTPFVEDMSLNMAPKVLVAFLAKGKAEAVASGYADAIIIGADTFIVLEDKVMGKPKSKEEAASMLQRLSGRQHVIMTGLCVLDTREGKIITEVSEAKISFRQLSAEEIDSYIETGEPFDRAGAYAIQGGASTFVEKLDGDFDTVVGLPLQLLLEILKKDFSLDVSLRV